MKPIILVVGAGAGIGGHVSKRFAREGYHAVLCRRSKEAGLHALVAEIEAPDQTEAATVDLFQVIEDECLLALPASPKHDDCAAAKTQAGDIDQIKPDNPFAQLSQLKK